MLLFLFDHNDIQLMLMVLHFSAAYSYLSRRSYVLRPCAVFHSFNMRISLFFSSFTLASSALAAATCKVQTPGIDTENGVVDGNCCTPLTIIFARGTTEFGNVGTFAGPPFFHVLRSQLGNSGVLVQGVDYPASLVVC